MEERNIRGKNQTRVHNKRRRRNNYEEQNRLSDVRGLSSRIDVLGGEQELEPLEQTQEITRNEMYVNTLLLQHSDSIRCIQHTHLLYLSCFVLTNVCVLRRALHNATHSSYIANPEPHASHIGTLATTLLRGRSHHPYGLVETGRQQPSSSMRSDPRATYVFSTATTPRNLPSVQSAERYRKARTFEVEEGATVGERCGHDIWTRETSNVSAMVDGDLFCLPFREAEHFDGPSSETEIL